MIHVKSDIYVLCNSIHFFGYCRTRIRFRKAMPNLKEYQELMCQHNINSDVKLQETCKAKLGKPGDSLLSRVIGSRPLRWEGRKPDGIPPTNKLIYAKLACSHDNPGTSCREFIIIKSKHGDNQWVCVGCFLIGTNKVSSEIFLYYNLVIIPVQRQITRVLLKIALGLNI